MRKPTNEDTMDMKTDRGSITRTKSSPRTKGRLQTSSPPPKANGMSVMGRTTVTAPRAIDQADRAAREIAPARGMVRDPRIGTRTVKRVIVSVFMRLVIY
jgi:hypothetical protein